MTALALPDLRLHAPELCRHLGEQLDAGNALDAFLLAAGLQQVAEDVVERAPLRLDDAQRVLGGPAARVARAAAAAATVARLRHRGVARWAAQLDPLVSALADAVMVPGAALPTRPAFLERLPRDRALAAAVTRPPTAFRDLEQHPDDLRELARRIAGRAPDGPLLVAGIRTSGSYLGPLLAAALRAEGVDASALSLRPHVHPLRAKRRSLRAARTVVVTDDPPSSGGSIAAVAAQAGRHGARVVLALQLLAGQDELPPALRDHDAVLLGWDEWSLHARLAPAAVAATLARLTGEQVAVERLPGPPAAGRSHHRARYRAGDREFVVEGAGLGYLGAHLLAVERRLGGWVTPALGLQDGLAYREVPPGDTPATGPAVADAVAGYAAARRQRLPLAEDASLRLAGQDPVWEVAANQLAPVFGRTWRPLRMLAVDDLCRRLLRSGTPSLVDGRMAPAAWRSSAGGLVKLHAAERAYSSRNLASSDAAYDVAAAAVAWPELAGEMRDSFARSSGERIDAERWLVLRLVATWAAERDGDLDAAGSRRQRARVLQDYFAEVYLDDLAAPTEGPLCALDLDGVLETNALGVPSLSPASGRALRALRAHGHRVVLATGRSGIDVADRVRAYGLAGGVAEYGAVLVDAAGATRTVATAHAELTDADLDPDYQAILRVRAPRDVDAPAGLRAVRGDDQTDLVPVGVDKATGLAQLTSEPPAFAVGDTEEDLPLLALAALAAVPGHARRLRSDHVLAMRRPYQAGLEQAVGRLIGHAPGGCPACAAAPAERDRRLLLRVLGARERGAPGMAQAAVGLTVGVRR